MGTNPLIYKVLWLMSNEGFGPYNIQSASANAFPFTPFFPSHALFTIFTHVRLPCSALQYADSFRTLSSCPVGHASDTPSVPPSLPDDSNPPYIMIHQNHSEYLTYIPQTRFQLGFSPSQTLLSHTESRTLEMTQPRTAACPSPPLSGQLLAGNQGQYLCIKIVATDVMLL